MHLRSNIKGLSVQGLPPAKVTMFADDTNIFLSAGGPSPDDIPHVFSVLESTTMAIGSKFNNEKTEVKPVGSLAFKETCHGLSSLAGYEIPGTKIMDPYTPVRILGVWIGSYDRSQDRWNRISAHIKKLISQWSCIQVSARNRVLIAKALLLSRCYYL